ncbi:MAG TPA: hypothetical protein VFR37_21510 [Longimicrobium sp.]|nr:hypothetical protein [Longimicrobium sp.]
MKRIWSVVLALVLAACAENPVGLQQALVLQAEPSQAEEESAVIEGAVGAVVVRGVYDNAAEGTLVAHFHEGRDGVRVYIGSTPQTNLPLQAPGKVSYHASVPVRGGTHRVRVFHLDTSAGFTTSREIARDAVTIPRQ